MTKVTTIDSSLITAVQNAAHHLSLVAPSLASQSKTYETWMAFELGVALHKDGASVEALDHKCAATTVFRVRGGPGYMVPAAAGGFDEPCHFQIDWNAGKAEMHISLVHGSQHGNFHEIDVCVVDHAWATMVRQQAHPVPFHGTWLVGAELKAYGPTKTLDKNIARAAVGLLLDLAPAAIAPSVQFRSRAGQVLLSGQFNGPQYFVFTSAQLAQPSVQLLNTYGIKSGASVWPNNANAIAAIATIVADIKQRL